MKHPKIDKIQVRIDGGEPLVQECKYLLNEIGNATSYKKSKLNGISNRRRELKEILEELKFVNDFFAGS